MSLSPDQPLDRYNLNRNNLAARTLEVLNRGGWGNPDVLLVETDNDPVVVKDYAPRPWLTRRAIGRLVLRREARAIQALHDHSLVPQFLGMLDNDAMVLEYRPGRRMAPELSRVVDGQFIDRLRRGVRQMHEMGVVHLDLRNRGNVLAGEDGQPVLLDFASALRLNPAKSFSRKALDSLGRLDESAVDKWQSWLQQPSETSMPSSQTPS